MTSSDSAASPVMIRIFAMPQVQPRHAPPVKPRLLPGRRDLRGEGGGQGIEVGFGGPGFAIADDVETAAGAGDSHVEEVGGLGGETAGPGPGRVAAEDQDYHVGFLALHGVDGAYPLGAVPGADVGEDRLVHPVRLGDDLAERADDTD